MWVFNQFLFWIWQQVIVLVVMNGSVVTQTTLYQQFVAAGSPCYVYVSALADPAFPQDPKVPPPCWYDPTNLNSGVPQQ